MNHLVMTDGVIVSSAVSVHAQLCDSWAVSGPRVREIIMFEVRATYPLDEDFHEKDNILRAAAEPFKSSFSGAGACRDRGCSGREIGFETHTCEEAVELRQKLERSGVDDLSVIIREL